MSTCSLRCSDLVSSVFQCIILRSILTTFLYTRYLASGGEDGSVVVWDLASGKVLADLTHLTTCDLPPIGATASTPSEGIVELSWSKDSKLLVVGSIDGYVRTLGVTPSGGDR